jgi:hypothetical protein
MKTIKLNKDYYAVVDDDLYDYLNQWEWTFRIFNGKGYAIRRFTINNKTTFINMDHLINSTPKGYTTEHINNKSLDNRRSNLRTGQQTSRSESFEFKKWLENEETYV